MPKGVVKTPADEKKWDKAKEIVEESHGADKPWALVMKVYQNMKKDEEPSRDALIERALDHQGRKTTMPQEAHAVLHDWWQSNKDRLLSPEQKSMLGRFKEAKTRRSQMRVVKGEEDLDHLQKSLAFLKEVMEGLAKAEDDPKEDWKPSRVYHPHEEAAVNDWKKKGFSHREAAHMANVEPAQMRYDEKNQSWKTDHRASELSSSALQLAKMVAKKYMDRHAHERGQKAMENMQQAPMVAEHHHTKQVTANAAADWDSHLKRLKESGAFANLKPHEVAKAIMQHKKDFYAKNVDAIAAKHGEMATQLKDMHNKALDAAEEHRVESMRSILQGGQGAPVEASSQYSEQPDLSSLEEISSYGEDEDK